MSEPKCITLSDGTVKYYLNGKLHREDGPAVVSCDGTVEYWLNGKRHRKAGPAVIYPNGTVEYWLNRRFIYKDQLKTVKEIQNKPEVKPVAPTNLLEN